MIKRSLCLLTALVLTTGGPWAMAETAWVTDRIMADVFTEPDTDSNRVATLMSGDEIELLEGSEGDFVQIRTGGGVSGWIEAGFISMDAPAAERLGGLESERDELAAQLSEAETELESVRNELEAVRRQGGNREQQLNQARNRAEAAEQELAAYRERAEEAEARLETVEAELEAAANEDDDGPEELVVFLPAFEQAAEATAEEPADSSARDRATHTTETRNAGMLPLFSLFGAAALLLSGLAGYRLRERQLRKRLGGLSL